MTETPGNGDRAFYAQTYDVSVPDWPGEIDFYSGLAREAGQRGEAILEVACGTGRVAIRLAKQGGQVVGLDHSPPMLTVARQKSTGIENIHWVQADMRAFDLGEKLGLVLIPGHAFQNLNTSNDQVACLECIWQHLTPRGKLVVHLDNQDVTWLGGLVQEKGGRFEPAEEFRHPKSGHLVRTQRAWWYEPSTQTATSQTAWEVVDENGQVVERWQTPPTHAHCVFPFEMEHLLRRVGYSIEAVYGDFFRSRLEDSSPGMIWVARRG